MDIMVGERAEQRLNLRTEYGFPFPQSHRDSRVSYHAWDRLWNYPGHRWPVGHEFETPALDDNSLRFGKILNADTNIFKV